MIERFYLYTGAKLLRQRSTATGPSLSVGPAAPKASQCVLPLRQSFLLRSANHSGNPTSTRYYSSEVVDSGEKAPSPVLQNDSKNGKNSATGSDIGVKEEQNVQKLRSDLDSKEREVIDLKVRRYMALQRFRLIWAPI